MADITEVEQWDAGVYQLETTDPVQGGADGIDNLPHKHLANRTLWLKAGLEAVQNAISTLGNTFALLGGNANQRFKVADAVNDDEAVNKLQTLGLIDANAVGLGIDQTWQDVSSSRSMGVTYTNTSGKPICVAISFVDPVASNSTQFYFYINGVMVFEYYIYTSSDEIGNIFCVIPNGATYSTSTGNESIRHWHELR